MCGRRSPMASRWDGVWKVTVSVFTTNIPARCPPSSVINRRLVISNTNTVILVPHTSTAFVSHHRTSPFSPSALSLSLISLPSPPRSFESNQSMFSSSIPIISVSAVILYGDQL